MDENYTIIEIKPFKSVKSTLITLGIFFLVGISIVILWEGEDATPITIPDGPVKIELIGIRPNGGPNIYSPVTGEKISMPMPLSMAPGRWGASSLQLDLIFQLPKEKYPIHLHPVTYANLPDNSMGFSLSREHNITYNNDRTIAVMSMTFPKRYHKKVIYWDFLEQVDKLDFPVYYSYGPLDERGGIVFHGPFTKGTPVTTTKRDKEYSITAENSSEFITLTHLGLHQVMAYDRNGKSYVPQSTYRNNFSKPDPQTEIYFDSIKASEIETIQFHGHKGILRFKNIPVKFPRDLEAYPDREYPVYHGALMKRLGMTLGKGKELRYRDLSSQQLLDGIDLLDGPSLFSVVYKIKKAVPPIDFKSLDEWQQENIQNTLEGWYESGFAVKQYAAVELGLHFGLQVYIDRAMEIYSKNIRRKRGEPRYLLSAIRHAMEKGTLLPKPRHLIPVLVHHSFRNNANILIKNICEQCSKEKASEIFLNYLKQTRVWLDQQEILQADYNRMACREIIQRLNLWYGVNVGGLGVYDAKPPGSYARPRNVEQLKTLIDKALEIFGEV